MAISPFRVELSARREGEPPLAREESRLAPPQRISVQRRQRRSVAAECLRLNVPSLLLLLAVVQHATRQTAIHQAAISQNAYKQTHGRGDRPQYGLRWTRLCCSEGCRW